MMRSVHRQFFHPSLLFLISSLFLISLSCTLGDDDRVSPSHDVSISRGDLFDDINLDQQKIITQATLSIPPYVSAVNNSTSDCSLCMSHFVFHLVTAFRSIVTDTCSAVLLAPATNPTGENKLQSTLNATQHDRCKWISQHKHEWIGYILARTKPFQMGHTYCFDANYCNSSPSSSSSSLSSLFVDVDYTVDSIDLPSVYLRQLASSVDWVERALRESNPASQSAESTKLTPPSSSDPSTVTIPLANSLTDLHLNAHHSPEQRCHLCLNHAIRSAMRRAIRHIKYQCQTSTDTVFVAWCQWANSSTDLRSAVRAMMYATTQPFVSAGGWCIGQEVCTRESIDHAMNTLPFTMLGGRPTRPKEKNRLTEPSNRINKRTKYF